MAAMFLFAGLISVGIFLDFKGTTGLEASLIKSFEKSGNLKEQNHLNEVLNTPSCGDIDQDGLCDEEEPIYRTDPLNKDTDGDGFLDGEEVAAERDPTKAGPDDLLPKDAANVTDKISRLMAGAYLSGDLDPDANPETYNKTLADISYEMLADNSKILDPANIPLTNLIRTSDSKEAQEKYLNQVESIIENELWGQLINEPRVLVSKFTNFNAEDPGSISDSRRYFKDKAKHYQEVLNKFSSLAEPPSWLNVHQKILTGLQTLIINHQALSQTNDDPLKGVAAVENLMNIYQEIQPLTVEIAQNIKKNNLNQPGGPLWGLIYSLTDGL